MPVPSLPKPPKGGPSIRRVVVTLVAVVVAAAILLGSSPVDAAARKVKLGVSMTEGSRDIAAMDEIKAETGRYPAIWTVWSAWGNANTKKFPSGMVKQIKARGAVPLVFWEPVQKFGVCTDHARFKKIKNGKFDWYIKSWAKAAKASRTKILLRFAHEVNGRYFPWTVGSCGNTVADYKAAWKRVYNLVRNKVGAKNVQFVWTVAKKSCPGGCNPYKRFYPGNQYVQWVGFSNFNWGAHSGNWAPMAKGINPVMGKFKQFTKKQVIIAELATNEKGGPTGNPAVDKPAWIKTGYRETYKKYPRIKAVVYLNEDLRSVGHPDWSLDSPNPEAMQAYRVIVNDWRFKGRF